MNQRIFLFIVFILIAFQSCAESLDSKNDSQDIHPEEGRYEIVMSDLTAKLTFRIDKFDGDLYQLVRKKDDSLTWERIKRESSSNDKTYPNKVNYHFYTSVLAARYTFLININTGVTWQIVSDSDDNLYLELIR